MKHQMKAGAAGLLVAATVALSPSASALPATAAGSAATSADSTPAAATSTDAQALHRSCLRQMRRAVEEDNAAFDARDARRYRAVLNPDLVVDRDGAVTYGRKVAMEKAIAFFKVPGWRWNTTILSATVYGCSTGVAIVDAHQVDAQFDYHAHVAMTMTKATGKWTVAMDYVHLLEKTPVS